MYHVIGGVVTPPCTVLYKSICVIQVLYGGLGCLSPAVVVGGSWVFVSYRGKSLCVIQVVRGSWVFVSCRGCFFTGVLGVCLLPWLFGGLGCLSPAVISTILYGHVSNPTTHYHVFKTMCEHLFLFREHGCFL
ncbi:hypothetical protein L208DRAFT_1377407 [Tricholoma matsutake]|nr:hypothetical protein L208DRAFT_1377407 [Tricholoma matsutake 945]